MTKEILDELTKAPVVAKELTQYLSRLKIDANLFLLHVNNIQAYAEFLIFFHETYGLRIDIQKSDIVIRKGEIMVYSGHADLPIRQQLTLSIVYAIRYANNPF